MKRQILSLAIAAVMIGGIAGGCSSKKDTGTSDTTKIDTTKKMTPAPAPDTMKRTRQKKIPFIINRSRVNK